MPRLGANHPAIWCLLALSFGSLTPAPVRAQYMYLDTNGDGQSNEADTVSPTGTTLADVWLRTDQNRAGAAAVCPTEDRPMTIISYEFILRANGGSVSWGAITNRMSFPVNLGTTTLGSDAHVGFGGGTFLPPGTYRLATVAFTRLSGSPAIEIVSTTPISGAYGTNFGSGCSGNDFDNTLKLGSDWFDVDGASWGGTPNHVPVFAPIPTLVATEGQATSLSISAVDADGDAIQFHKVSGPGYFTVLTTDPASGTGSLQAAPSYLDAGVDSATVSASDGFRTSLASVRIEVADSPASPALSVGNMRVLAGGTADQVINAFDADGDAGQITFELVSGPAFVNVGTLPALSPSTARGQIHLAPSSLDIGTSSATVAAVKGTLRGEAIFQIGVLAEAPANRPCVVSDMISVTMPNETTRNIPFSARDPDGDVLSARLVSGQSFVSIEILTSSPGSLSGIIVIRPLSTDIGDHTITLGAYDGIAESRASFALHVLGSSPPRFTVLQDMSVGAGLSATQTIWATTSDPDATYLTFSKASGPAYVSVQTQNSFPTYAFAVVTLRPALDDVGEAIAQIAVSDGVRTATAPMQIEVRRACPSMRAAPVVPLDGAQRSLVGDIDGDHALDLLAISYRTNDVIVRLGNGDGTFREAPALVGVAETTSWLLRDLNGDGRADLVTAGGVNSGVFVRLSLGGGAFGPPLATPISGYSHDPEALSVAEMNSDGRIDLIVGEGGVSPSVRVLLGAGDGTFTLAGSAAISSPLMTLATGDLNRDGREDVVVGQYYTSFLLVIHGDGAGGFGTTNIYPDGYSAHSVAVGDLNGDAWPDLVLAHDQLSVWFNDGTGSFLPAWQSHAPYRLWSATVGDVTGDGRNDVVATGEEWFDQTRGSALVFAGIEADSLETPTGTIFDRHVIDASLADLNRDGRPDLVATGQDAVLAYFNLGCRPNAPPTANPGGPYAGTVGVPLSFDGSASSDPEGAPLTYNWDFGDDHQANGAQVEHAYLSVGSYSVTLAVSDGELTVSATTTATITAVLSARAFVLGASRTTPLFSSDRPSLCIQLEPEGGSFQVDELIAASLIMRSAGAVGEIGVRDLKGTVIRDRDHNGVAEMTACFARADLRSLLGPLEGRTEVTLVIEGALQSGALIRATLELAVTPSGPFSTSIYPNPMNPTSRLSLMLPRPGRLRAILFDVSGRLVRVLVDEPQAAAGFREIAIDGRDDHGRPLTTGIYFYRVESAGDARTGQIVILK